MTVTVVGAGVAGLICAIKLAVRGHQVEVIEQSVRIDQNACSWFAGGMLAPWCEAESAEPEVVELGLPAIDWWDRQFSGVTRRGTLVVSQARDRSDLERFSRRTRGHSQVGSDRIAELEPDLAGRFDQALFFANEAHLNPRDALAALQNRLNELGVPIRYNSPLPPASERIGPVVDCRGLSARDRLTDLRGVRGEMLLLRSHELRLSRTVRMLHPRFPVYIVPHGNGLYMVGATMIESDSAAPISVRSIMELLGAAIALHPAFGEAEILETGVGVRPAFEDNFPDVRRDGDTVYVNGLYRHGYLLAPAMADRAADMIATMTQEKETSDADIRERTSA
jgi:glycine oxidase